MARVIMWYIPRKNQMRQTGIKTHRENKPTMNCLYQPTNYITSIPATMCTDASTCSYGADPNCATGDIPA